ncbi:hypothetical protein OAB57_00300 [Bacteriovoracaceae bacterium]|nr:hypothetical protein [Bacteriovoracaceae bacterium]
MKQILVIITFMMGYPCLASDLPPVRFGIELTQTSKEIIHSSYQEELHIIATPISKRALAIMGEMQREKCRSRRENGNTIICFVVREVGKYDNIVYRVKYKDRTSSKVLLETLLTNDPYVLEYNATPLTVSDMERFQNILEEDLFDLPKNVTEDSLDHLSTTTDNRRAKQLVEERESYDGYKDLDPNDVLHIGDRGLKPHKRIGQGHLHIGIDTFSKKDEGVMVEDPQLFRNFIVDYVNHPTLSMGGLGAIPNNAPPLGILEKKQQNEFRNVIAEFDANKIPQTIFDLAYAIENRVYSKTYSSIKSFSDHPKKYQALNFSKITSLSQPEANRTLEIRGIRPQRSFKDLLGISRLFEARLNMLRKEGSPIALQLYPLKHSFRQILNPQRVISEFFEYVTGSKLDWEFYRFLLSDELFDELERRKWVWNGEKDIGLERPINDVPEDEAGQCFPPFLKNITRQTTGVSMKLLRHIFGLTKNRQSDALNKNVIDSEEIIRLVNSRRISITEAQELSIQ